MTRLEFVTVSPDFSQLQGSLISTAASARCNDALGRKNRFQRFAPLSQTLSKNFRSDEGCDKDCRQSFLSWPRFVQGEDLQTSEGTVFTNAAVIRYEAEGIVVKHDAGTNRVAWKQLPAPTRQRFQAEARKQKEAEIQKLKQDLARAESEAAVLNEDHLQTPSQVRSPAEKPLCKSSGGKQS